MSRPATSPEGAPARGAAVPASGSLLCIDIPGVVVRREPMGPGWQAHAEGDPAQWSRGDSQDEAIGGLIRRLALEFEGANWRRAVAPPPAAPTPALPAAEIGQQAGRQGPESLLPARFLTGDEAAIVGPELVRKFERRGCEAFRRGIQLALERQEAAEAKAAELAAEVERLCRTIDGSASQHVSDGAAMTAMLCRDSAAIARALLARLGFRPGQP